jgi:carbamoyltransferase
LPREIRRELDGEYIRRIVFTEHHESHAASAFYPSPFDEAAIITLDGVGEWATASYGVGRGNQIELTHELRFPHSLGLLYSAFTYFTGFKVNSGEYKLMGLAPYGEPRYVDLILQEILNLHDDGSFSLDLDYFNYCQGLTMTSKNFDRLFGGPPREPESPLTQREMDLAASIQKVTEEVMLRIARHVHAETGMRRACLAGGVALNCVGNGRILEKGPFDEIWIQPGAGDAGGALGAALFIWHQLLDNPRETEKPDGQHGSLLGPSYPPDEIESFLAKQGAVAHRFSDLSELDDRIVSLIEDEKVVGLFHGRMEFGPRALGCRSIIGDARSRAMQSVMNLKIKFRESFRPFAPIVLAEHADEVFEMAGGQDSPYMLVVSPVADAMRLPVEESNAVGLDKLKVTRSRVPAITHVDHSARVQTVDAERYPRLHQLMTRFFERTDCPVLINTSFNVRGEPIVCTPEHAYHCFMGTEMDVLVLEDYLLLKEDQPESAIDRENYLSKFELD